MYLQMRGIFYMQQLTKNVLLESETERTIKNWYQLVGVNKQSGATVYVVTVVC
jgi:hypothetical protein